MAIGLGLMLGFHFPINFNSPYKSASITEFWRRWHISLSAWLRDYLYVPLGGNRKGTVRTAINLMVTMLLGGFWHGANWTFLIWGGYQGVWLAAERANGRKPLYAAAPRIIRILITFAIVVVGWVFFKSQDIEDAGQHLAAMVGLGGEPTQSLVLGRLPIFALCIAALLAFFTPNSQTFSVRDPLWWAVTMQVLFILAIATLFLSGHVPFLYYKF
jgi:alginate O-acetyltransferase complex protein AlgI